MKKISLILIVIFVLNVSLLAKEKTKHYEFKILHQSGNVYVTSPDSGTFKSKTGLRLFRNYEVKTKKNSFADLIFSDSSTINIGGNTEIKINEFKVKKKDKTNIKDVFISLKKGRLVTDIKYKEPESKVVITTLTAGSEINNSHLTFEFLDESRASVERGSILFYVKSEPDTKYRIKENESVRIIPGSNKVEIIDNNLFNSPAEKKKLEFVRQSYKLVSSDDDNDVYEYDLEVKDINPENAKVVLIVLDENGNEYSKINMSLESGMSAIKKYTARVLVKNNGKFTHRYMIETKE